VTGLAIAVAVLLLFGNAFFVAAEFALVSVRRSQIEPLADGGDRRAHAVLRALENLSAMLAAAQLGITVCSLLLGALAEPAVARLLEPAWHALGLPPGLVHPFAYVLALVLVVGLHMVVGEMVPKNLALASPEKAALRLGPALAGVARGLRPVVAVCNGAANLVLRALRVEPRDEVAAAFTADELAELVHHSVAAGLLPEGRRERLADALELGFRPVREVALPLERTVAVEPGVTPRQVEELVAATGYSRFPVRAGDAGFLGYLHVKDVLEVEERMDDPVPRELWHPLPALPHGLPLDDALTAMRRAGVHLAAVVGPDGRVRGLVALEDVLEELVGEVHDPAHRVP